LDTAKTADTFQTAVIVINLIFSMATISQGQVRLQFTAAMPDQDGMVVIAVVCCSCWFISVMPMQHRFHQQFKYHTTASCNTILHWVTQWNLMGSVIDQYVEWQNQKKKISWITEVKNQSPC